jgi:hypothetical protein
MSGYMEITFIPSSMVSTYLILTSLAYLWSLALNFILRREVESIPQDCEVTFQEHKCPNGF